MSEQQMPKYLQLKQQILSWIVTAQFKPHDRLPSEHEISQQFAMSRQTVRQALGELEQEGWLYRERGKGTFVSGHNSLERRNVPPGMTIGMITTHISDYIFPTIVRGVESGLRARGARLLLASTDNEKRKEQESLESMLHEQLDGLIIEPTKSAEGNPNFNYFLALEARGIPYVMLNERYTDLDAPCLRLDDELGGYLAAKHLLSLGHRRIAGLFKTDDFQGVHRMRGFLRAHREYGVSVDPQVLVRYVSEDKQERPARELKKILDAVRQKRPTALVCYNDQLAVKMLDVVRGCNLSVPSDLSIVGFDDANLAVATEVKLTTLAHPKTQMGTDAVDLLFNVAKQQGTGNDRVYEPVLVIRDSTAPPNEGTTDPA